MQNQDCIFCQIVSGQIPSYKIWEDGNYLAFLTIFPNTEGFSVVIPKNHYSSYAFDLPDEILTGLTLAAKGVGKLLDNAFDDVGRTAMVYEGFGVDHVHAKLIPLHGTKTENFKPIHSKNIDKKYFNKYEGYLCTYDFDRADDEKLAKLAKAIKEGNGKFR